MLTFSVSSFTGPQIHVGVNHCYVGQERDPNDDWRWVLPYEVPCTCTSVRLGGINMDTPERSFDPTYVEKPLVSDDVEEIRDHFGLKSGCKGW